MLQDNQPQRRQPRSAARRAAVGAQIGAQYAPPDRPPLPEEERDAPAYERHWEDTSTVLAVPEQTAFFRKQPPVFWIAVALLMVSLFVVVGIVGVNALRESSAKRLEQEQKRQWDQEEAKYKLLYRDLIEDYASEQGLPPALVAAVIYHESRFDPKAESYKGARGLMQVMEPTAAWIAHKLDEEDGYTFDRMYDAEINIRFGTWYMGYLSRLYGGDPVKIAASYHAGQNTVAAWLKNPEYSSDGFALDVIPNADTDQYVKRVVNAYEIYTKHYYPPEEDQPAPDGAA